MKSQWIALSGCLLGVVMTQAQSANREAIKHNQGPWPQTKAAPAPEASAESLVQECAQKMADYYGRLANILSQVSAVDKPDSMSEEVFQKRVVELQSRVSMSVAQPSFPFEQSTTEFRTINDVRTLTKEQLNTRIKLGVQRFSAKGSPTPKTYDPKKSTWRERLSYSTFFPTRQTVKVKVKEGIREMSGYEVLCSPGDVRHLMEEARVPVFTSDKSTPYLLAAELNQLRNQVQEALSIAKISGVPRWEKLFTDAAAMVDNEMFQNAAVVRVMNEQLAFRRANLDLGDLETQGNYDPEF